MNFILSFWILNIFTGLLCLCVCVFVFKDLSIVILFYYLKWKNERKIKGKTFQDGVDGGAPLDTPRRNNSKCFCEKFGQRFPPGRKAFYSIHVTLN